MKKSLKIIVFILIASLSLSGCSIKRVLPKYPKSDDVVSAIEAARHVNLGNKMIQRRECVILLHGIMRSSTHMVGLARFLKGQGYRVINVDYPSTKLDLFSLSEFVWKRIKEQVEEEEIIHFIGYSMGGLVVRAIINRYKLNNLGRVVMIGTPNQGSQISDSLRSYKIYVRILGPAGQQLTTNQSEFQSVLGKLSYETGIIAGSINIYPLGWFLLEGKNDGRVTVENTKIDGMSDHVTVQVPHFYLPYSKTVQRLTLNFLRHGAF